MRVAIVAVPGRFPTVIHDSTKWVQAIAPVCTVVDRLSLNYRWWSQMCSSEVVNFIEAANAENKIDSKNDLNSVFTLLVETGKAASKSLIALQSMVSYLSADEYRRHVEVIETHLKTLNLSQSELVMSFASGPITKGVNFGDCAEIARVSKLKGLLSQTIVAALGGVSGFDLFLLRVTTEFDLLSAAIVAHQLKLAVPNVHICLVDHGYENFSLSNAVDRLDASGHLEQCFDTIVARKDEIERVLLDLVESIRLGNPPKGFLAARTKSEKSLPLKVTRKAKETPLCLEPSFSPAPIVQIRLSPNRCYWSRCTYCTQNAKYEGNSSPAKWQIGETISYIQKYYREGVRHFIFSDEAISPAMLLALADDILDSGMAVSWSCRCKLEKAFDDKLFAKVAIAGCQEILFGLETTSPTLLQKMDKVVDGLDDEAVARIFATMAHHQIGIHVNLISGFPGETLEEAEETIRFVIRCLRHHPNATFKLNRFTVFPNTPISQSPWMFGISELSSQGDIPVALPFRLNAECRRRTVPVMQDFERLNEMIAEGLGWQRFIGLAGGRDAFDLYSSSGHSMVFKALQENPLDLGRSPSIDPPKAKVGKKKRQRAFLTGASGTVGRSVLDEMLRQDWDVILLGREASSLKYPCEVVRADLHDLPDLSRYFDGLDTIVHCASPRSLNRGEMLSGEVEATGRLLDAWSTGAFVYASSQTLYGEAEGILVEEARPSCDNWYDLAKLANEHQVDMMARKLSAVGLSLRVPLVFANGSNMRGQQYLNQLLTALRRGDQFLFQDKKAMQEQGTPYIGPEDLGRAFLSATALESRGIYNLSTGFVVWYRLLEIMSEMTGIAVNYIFRTDGYSKKIGVFKLPESRAAFDSTKFETASGFKPSEKLEEIVANFIRSEQNARTLNFQSQNDTETWQPKLVFNEEDPL
jgi:nucleoside-diphosphate-sugar epimerase